MPLTANEKPNSKLFRVNLEMRDNNLDYEPSFDENADKSFMKTITDLISDICSVTSQIKKIAQPIGGSTAPNLAVTYQSTFRFAIHTILNSQENS